MTKYIRPFVIFILLSCANSYARGKLSVIEETILDTDAATVWAVVGNFDGLTAWLPPIARSELDGTGTDTGDIRILTLRDGNSIIEKLTGYDNGQMEYSYEILDGPLPLKNYQATIKIEPIGNQCKFTWTSTFDANGVSDEEAIDIITGIYKAGSESLTQRFNTSQGQLQ